MKRLNELFDVEQDYKIEAIHSDSRYVVKNSIFFCVDGLSVDGHKYIEDAIFQGAKCIVYSKPITYKHRDIVYIKVDNVLDELNRVADLFYDHPSYKMTVMGITGTSGKTVVALMIKDILSHYLKTGYIGTNSIEYDGIVEQCPYTTPESIFLHKKLNEMVKHDVKGVALEVSSHGLALKRVDTVHFDMAIFTNVYEEHLDFHGTMEHLMTSKAKLFHLVNEKGYAILNTDEVRFYNLVKDDLKCHILTYGIEHRADVMARNIQLFIDHSEFDLQIHDELRHISVPLLGRCNVSNVLAVVTALLALEMSPQQVIESIGYIKGIDGRMELLEHRFPFHVIVDYCQHARSYELIFQFAKSVKKTGRIIAVFGAPGRRNMNKREKIGKLANEYCDQVILTAEDNRDEDIEDICLEIQKYIEKPISVIIEDRAIAIEQAIEIANGGDIILILGKGHEQFMASSIGNVPYPGDKYVALNAIHKIFEGGEEDEI
ncbi:MAG: UDP-N-acetylmuramoyl-L-alanyl-D-glutamate--2,6-diaminopimelate ligase [Erysipelotrichaceae bacterium]|nr:UDP-N-acetylmuramoyl-L-alanyl-D-glutamate--2,6-diaminopimelate ligase [Erysipelotrichaceae bacterium]